MVLINYKNNCFIGCLLCKAILKQNSFFFFFYKTCFKFVTYEFFFFRFCKTCSDPDAAPSFSFSLLQALLECLPLLPSGYSAGALRWFFTLLNIVKCMNATLVAEKCVNMLTTVAKHYHDRDTPLHSLLKAR